MDTTILHTIFTVVLFVLFIGLFVWAYSRSPLKRFETAQQLPFEDDELHQRSVVEQEKHQ